MVRGGRKRESTVMAVRRGQQIYKCGWHGARILDSHLGGQDNEPSDTTAIAALVARTLRSAVIELWKNIFHLSLEASKGLKLQAC